MTIDVWGSFGAGMRLGGALRQRQKEEDQAQTYGDAYTQGGWRGVADAAGGMGDIETADTVQDNQTAQEETAYTRATRNAEVLANAATSLMGLPYEQRRARVEQMAPMLEQMGLDPAMISQFDPTDEALANVRAVQGQFSQYTDIRQQGDAIVGIRPDGIAEVIRQAEPEWQTNGTTPYRVGADGQVELGQGAIPRVPTGAGMGAEQYQVLNADEVSSLGLPPGSYQRNGATGQITVVGRTRGQYTDAAAAAAQFASRMAAADQTLVQLEDEYTDPSGVFLARSGFGSEYERRVRQAQREFVNAILRKESGAVIVPDEFASAAQQYFPQPGDTRAVIEQKRAARRRAITGLENASQGAYEEWYGPGSGGELPPPPPPTGATIGADVGAMISGFSGRGQSQAPAGFTPEEWDALSPEDQRRVIELTSGQ